RMVLVDVNVIRIQPDLQLRQRGRTREPRLDPNGQQRDREQRVDAWDHAHDGTGFGGSRSMARMPRRNGYCNRIQATDELLPCQSKLGPGGVPGFDFGNGGTVKLSAPSRPSASTVACAQEASFQSLRVAGSPAAG